MILSIECLLRNIPNDYSYKCKYLDENADKIEVLFLGNSHFYYGINPYYIKLNSFNAAHYSQTLEYDYRIFEKYKSKLIKLKYIVIGIDYTTLFSNMGASTESWREKYYNIYYHINTSWSPRNNFELMTGNFEKNIKKVTSYLIKNKNNLRSSQLGWLKNAGTSTPLYIKESAIKRAERHRIINSLYLNENVNYLQKLIQATNGNNVCLLLLSTPVSKDYMGYLDGKKIQLNSITLNRVIKNKKASYYNYSSDRSFCYYDFFDADHLNEKGAKKLSLKINQLLH